VFYWLHVAFAAVIGLAYLVCPVTAQDRVDVVAIPEPSGLAVLAGVVGVVLIAMKTRRIVKRGESSR
jgi:hypothetical protein